MIFQSFSGGSRMRKLRLFVAATLPLAVAGGVLYAKALTPAAGKPESAVEATGYVCPITGEELPCPNCCPLNDSQK